MLGRKSILLSLSICVLFINFVRGEDNHGRAPLLQTSLNEPWQDLQPAVNQAEGLDSIIQKVRALQPGALEAYCQWLENNPERKARPAAKAAVGNTAKDAAAANPTSASGVDDFSGSVNTQINHPADAGETATTGEQAITSEQTATSEPATGSEQVETPGQANAGSGISSGGSAAGEAANPAPRRQAEKQKPARISERQRTMRQLAFFAGLVEDARDYAGKALYNPEYDKIHLHNLIRDALLRDSEQNSLAIEAVNLISRAWCEADSLVKTRDGLFQVYQDEIRQGKVSDATRLAWSLIRVGASHPDTRVKPGSFRFDRGGAEIELRHMGAEFVIRLDEKDYKKQVRAEVDGYRFRSGWPVLFQKPFGWMAELAQEMRRSGIAPEEEREWDVMEAPEGLIALAVPDNGGSWWGVPSLAFYRGELREVQSIPLPDDAANIAEEFTGAAKRLHDGIMGDESIPEALRQAFNPVLRGTYLPIDPRDYFDSDFCRRLIEADYLESHVSPLPPERVEELAAFRRALAKIDNGYDRFKVLLDEGETLVAVAKPGVDFQDSVGDEVRDPETGETLSRYQWRWEGADETGFHSPLPGRQLNALSVVEYYPGKHGIKPKGVPEVTEVWHALKGKLATYRKGAAAAEGNPEKWLEAVTLDMRGRRDDVSGPLGWNSPLHVPVRDDQGDPVLVATLNGVVPSPNFTGYPVPAERRAAEEEWLDNAARIFSTPGELALIYQVFFRYCSDSPLPETPNLIGSHYGLSDTHQTVYESLERRWVGRLIGDCDDLAEFFQNLADRQGKLCQVMQLPSHAAAGYLEETPEGDYAFVVLQTGPVLRFVSHSREGAVEKAYRHFEDNVGDTQFTIAAVPVLLRFADEETRTPFVLSARIYWDGDYAEDMIRVQEFWHLHTYSAGVLAMEKLLGGDREVGNIKELASLYERVGEYEKSAALRREELAEVKEDPQATLSALLDISLLHIAAKDKPAALGTLAEMGDLLEKLRKERPEMYRRAAAFRSSWAGALSRLGEPERAWELVRHDVDEAWKKDGKFSDTLLRTLVTMYDRMSIQRDVSEAEGKRADREAMRIRYCVRSALAKAFGKDYFSADDSYNKISSRYFLLGRYGVAVAGRKAGLSSLCLDGPYPGGERDHTARGEDLSELDWEWFRVMPRLYLAFAMEMLDRDENPELYDPVMARNCLEKVRGSAKLGAGLGSNVTSQDAIIKSDLVLSFLNRDLSAFNEVMAMVRDKNYASLYDDAAVVFGSYCGLVPLAEFDAWIEAFHRFFPGRQHYFKAAYRAMDKEHFGHAERLAEATPRFFPGDALLAGEVAGLKGAVDRLRKVRLEQGWDDRDWAALPGSALEPAAATWLREIVDVID